MIKNCTQFYQEIWKKSFRKGLNLDSIGLSATEGLRFVYIPMEEPNVMPLWQALGNNLKILVLDADTVSAQQLTDMLVSNEYEVVTTDDPESALRMLQDTDIHLVIADTVLCGVNQFELLHKLRNAKPQVPVILASDRVSSEMARRALKEGAADFISKNYDTDNLPVIVERNILRRTMELRREIDHKLEMQKTYRALLEILLSAVDMRDAETEGHSERVATYTMLIAQKMNIPLPEMIHIERGALLHDIGKIGIPDRILLKNGPLTQEEWEIMRQHPIIGYKMCSRLGALKEASKIVRHHHERYDGCGYPDGLKGEDIPLGARIFAIVDAYDAMTSDRPYRQAMTHNTAMAEILECSGKQFDPNIVQIFIEIPSEIFYQLRLLVSAMPDANAA